MDLRGRAKLTDITTSALGLSKENNGEYYRSRKCFLLKSPTASTDTDTETGVKIMLCPLSKHLYFSIYLGACARRLDSLYEIGRLVQELLVKLNSQFD